MTKQEEIRQKLIELFNSVQDEVCYPESSIKATEEALQFLHSQGVVIKAERELPKRDWYEDWGGDSGKAGHELVLKDMAGFTTEPLIKE